MTHRSVSTEPAWRGGPALDDFRDAGERRADASCGPNTTANLMGMVCRYWRRSFLAVLLCTVVSCLADPAQAGVDVWTSNGPEGGTVAALAIDPSTPATLYAGTLGGGVFNLNYARQNARLCRRAIGA